MIEKEEKVLLPNTHYMVNPINWDMHPMKESMRRAERFSERENPFTLQVLVIVRPLSVLSQ